VEAEGRNVLKRLVSWG